MMRTLVWRDFRRFVPTYIAVGIMFMIPYLFVAVDGAYIAMSGRHHSANWLRDDLLVASYFNVIIAIAICAIFSATSIGGDVGDKTLGFCRILPVDPLIDAASRFLVMLSSSFLAIGISVLVFMVFRSIDHERQIHQDDEQRLVLMGSAAVCIGVGWLFSSLVGSVGIATVAGIAGAILVPFALELFDVSPSNWLYVFTYSVISIACIVAGTAIHVRRFQNSS